MKNNFGTLLKEVEAPIHFPQKVMHNYSLSALEVDVMLFLATTAALIGCRIVSVRKISKSHVSLATDELYKKGTLQKVDSANRKRICCLLLHRPMR